MERDLEKRNRLIDEVTLNADGNTSKGALSLIERLRLRKAKAKAKPMLDEEELELESKAKPTAGSN